jgi:hypothetical protein
LGPGSRQLRRVVAKRCWPTAAMTTGKQAKSALGGLRSFTKVGCANAAPTPDSALHNKPKRNGCRDDNGCINLKRVPFEVSRPAEFCTRRELISTTGRDSRLAAATLIPYESGYVRSFACSTKAPGRTFARAVVGGQERLAQGPRIGHAAPPASVPAVREMGRKMAPWPER